MTLCEAIDYVEKAMPLRLHFVALHFEALRVACSVDLSQLQSDVLYRFVRRSRFLRAMMLLLQLPKSRNPMKDQNL